MGSSGPPKCRPPSYLVKVKRSESDSKSCFDLAENRAASSLWVGDHRYTRILWVTKLLWVQSDFKLKKIDFEKNRRCAPGPGEYPIKNCFGTTEGLPVSFNWAEGILAGQNPYGFKAMEFVFRQKKTCLVFSCAGRILIDKTASVRLKPNLCTSI